MWNLRVVYGDQTKEYTLASQQEAEEYGNFLQKAHRPEDNLLYEVTPVPRIKRKRKQWFQ